MKLLAIETSCDETAVCLVQASGTLENGDVRMTVLGNALYSQASLHAQYGGVYPNMARREHVHNLVPLMTEALNQARLLTPRASTFSHDSQQLTPDVEAILSREPELFADLQKFMNLYECSGIDAIAVTYGPGLEPALWVGVNFARALSVAWNIPLVAVNHMEGHILIAMMQAVNSYELKVDRDEYGSTNTYQLATRPSPFLSLLISGGHTELVLSETFLNYTIVGQTRDDAVGEAFDKVARLMSMPYPGGPEISRLAQQARTQQYEQITALPRPMIHDGSLDFSFSGLKTAVRRYVELHPLTDDTERAQLAREFEDAVTDVLVGKTLRAVEQYGAQSVIVSGGVSANTYIRSKLSDALAGIAHVLIPAPTLSTDNAVMIAVAGYIRAIRGDYCDTRTLRADGNADIGSAMMSVV